MSQRVTKCTVCGESGHSLIHCLNVCTSCNGDSRKCNCQEQKVLDANTRVKKLEQQLRAYAQPMPSQDAPTAPKVDRNDLDEIHRRYGKVLAVIRERKCSLNNAYRMAETARSTIRDFISQFCFLDSPCSFITFTAGNITDPTLNFRKFEVTPFSYQHLLLNSKRTNEAPVFIGPTALHYMYVYKKIPSVVSASCPELSGTARGNLEHIPTLFSRPKNSEVKDELEEEERRMTHSDPQLIEQLDAEKLKDWTSNSLKKFSKKHVYEAEFQARLKSLEQAWDEREKSHLPAGKKPAFHKYICEKAMMIQDNMLRPIRVNAGLGNPRRHIIMTCLNLPIVLKVGVDAITCNYGNQTASATENTEQTAAYVQQSPGNLGNQKSSDLENPVAAAHVQQLPAGNLGNQKSSEPETQRHMYSNYLQATWEIRRHMPQKTQSQHM
ncbi:hypothetical protein ACROYT_G014154 [Oculina patagonica]